jgi:transcriptional regulator with XRE-family HTH domain
MLQVIPRLNEILKEREMTQLQLSKITGIPQGTISKFDRNRQHMDVHLVTISRKLNVPIEELFKISEVLNDLQE